MFPAFGRIACATIQNFTNWRIFLEVDQTVKQSLFMDRQSCERPLRIFLWMVPRTNSTVFMKCLSFVDGAEVWMEPYSACHFNLTIYNPDWGKGLPVVERAKAELEKLASRRENVALKKLETEMINKYKNLWPQNIFNYPWLKEQLSTDPKDKRFIFIKEESFTIKDYMEYLPEVPTRHVFVIRHPKEVYTSLKNSLLHQYRPDSVQFSWDDFHIGDNVPYLPIKDLFKIHFDNWTYIKEHLEADPIIIDGFDLTSRPEVLLPRFFEKIGIPYKESYLHWSGDPEVAYSTWNGPSCIVIDSKKNTTFRAVESTKFERPKYPRGTSRPEWRITDELKE